MESTPPWLAADGLLAQFAKRRGVARQRYAQFVAEGMKAESPWKSLKGQVLLGDDLFVERVQAQLNSGKDDVQIPLAQRWPPPVPLDDIASQAADRKSAILAAYGTGGNSYQQIADYFGIHFATVGRVVRAGRDAS